jgi:hypothetical protein
MPSTWITHAGKKIIYTDFRGCQSETEMVALFDKAVQEVLASPDLVLTMNNFDGVSVSPRFVRYLESRGATYKHKVRAKAVLGVTGMKKILINTYSVLTGIDARAFDTEADALAYLTSKT